MTKRRISIRTWWLAFFATGLFAAVLSAFAYAGELPGRLDRDPFDKVIHFVIAGMLAFSLDGALARRAALGVPISAIVVLAGTGADEFMQRFSPNRSSNLPDFLADCAGVVVLVWLSRRVAE